MELVYQLGSGSKWQDNELRYSLRSVAMHGRNVTKITLLGHKPGWVKNVHHIPLPDPYTLRADNSWFKMKHICSGRVEPYVLMNDDFFLLRETDFEALPSYCYGTIEDLALSYKRKSDYVTAMLASERVLKNNGLPVKNYALHLPMLVEPQKAQPVFNKFSNQPGVSFRLVYGNIARRQPETEIPDVKICDWVSREHADNYIKDLPAFSIGDRFLTTEGKQFLNTLYPHKCQYEQ